MKKFGDDLLLDEALKAEEYLHESRTTLDGKANSVYAAAAVLAVQPSILLIAPDVTVLVLAVQCLGYVFLAGAVYWAYEALDLTEFPIPNPETNEEFRNNILSKALTTATETELRDKLLAGLVEAAKYRIARAKEKNHEKASKVRNALNWLLCALLTNVGAFILHLICRYLGFRYPLHP
jgi:hypothetical protein